MSNIEINTPEILELIELKQLLRNYRNEIIIDSTIRKRRMLS